MGGHRHVGGDSPAGYDQFGHFLLSWRILAIWNPSRLSQLRSRFRRAGEKKSQKRKGTRVSVCLSD